MWDIDIHEVKEIRTRTTVYFGIGAIKKIDHIAQVLKSKGIDKVIVMSGKNAYKATGAWDYVEKALKDNGIGYVNYDQVTPNPTTIHVNEATKIAKDFEMDQNNYWISLMSILFCLFDSKYSLSV